MFSNVSLTLIRSFKFSSLKNTYRMTTGTSTSAKGDLGDMRKPYNEKHKTFTEVDLISKDPIEQFESWFDVACQTTTILEANAMCLSTASKTGKPSARYVLLKGFDKEGFRFFTNYSSRKGIELEENPFAAITFYWEPLLRSVRIEGSVKKISTEVSDQYFHSRPRGSQISAILSAQSQPIPSRQTLIDAEEKLLQKYNDENIPIPRPENWGGYVVVPEVIEFWQGQSTRIHDRIRFRRPVSSVEPDGILTYQGDQGWIYERLSP
ncbi:pyridoxine-5'-phosphate oxidase [Daphnia magna]|uniref:pyridoxine-5'-phosphate oxidase n=1 Tax=Daphnia magna TaxID=35525 RepID=UPI0014029D32|nr:pyridoxine-5'-phosphate oxidase [Daphnia magna]